jgi:hypothetical protein
MVETGLILFDKVKEFGKITEQMLDLYKRKNSDYGDSFERTHKDFGIVAFIVRAQDKLNRINTIRKKDRIEVMDESIADTLLDLANYSIMTLIEIHKEAFDKARV